MVTQRTYMLERDADGKLQAWIAAPFGERRELVPRFDLRSGSVEDFDVGNRGDGAQHLALAILADALDDNNTALRLSPAFARDVIACIRLRAGEAQGLKWKQVSRWSVDGRFT